MEFSFIIHFAFLLSTEIICQLTCIVQKLHCLHLLRLSLLVSILHQYRALELHD